MEAKGKERKPHPQIAQTLADEPQDAIHAIRTICGQI